MLLKLLSDSDEYVRIYAVQSIVRLNEPSAVPDLVVHAKSTQPGLVLTNIMRALAELRDAALHLFFVSCSHQLNRWYVTMPPSLSE